MGDNNKEILLTEEGYKKMEAELEKLKTETRAEIAERIKLIAKSKGLTVSTVLKEVNLGRNTMANFKTSMPKADNLAKIADYLDCSIDYLMGRTDDPDLHKK